jgi:hypothetical protein
MICALALLPGLFWTGGLDTAAAMRHAGIEQFCAPPALAATWKQAGFSVAPLTTEELHSRIKLSTPGIDRKVMVASATTAPWVDANGWRFRRKPDGEFYYELGPRSAALAAAEAFAFGANAVLQIEPADLDEVGKMLQFLRTIPEKTLPDIADFGFIDDGSDDAAEILNLLSRRNLLYQIVRVADPRLRLNVRSNSDNPQLFAAKIREQLKDEQRSLRVYGSEVVLCRLVGDAAEARIHVLNYGRRALEGVRLRVRGSYAHAKLYAPGASGQPTDFAVAEGFTEFSLPEIGAYAVVDLGR